MANNNRTCPKCGTPLGQKNLCPVCNGQSQTCPPENGNENEGEAQNMSKNLSSNHIQDNSRLEEYKALKKEIMTLDKKNLSSYKPKIDELIHRYSDYFELDFLAFYSEMYQKKLPLAVLTLLMDQKWNTRLRESTYGSFPYAPLYGWEDYKLELNVLVHTAFIQTSFGSSNVVLSFWNEGYNDLINMVENAPDSRIQRPGRTADKPIEFITLKDNVNAHFDWEWLIPEEKRVLILYCGGNLCIKTRDNPEPIIGSSVPPLSIVQGLQCRKDNRKDMTYDLNAILFTEIDDSSQP